MFTPPEGEGRNSLHMFQAALKKLRSFSASALRAMAYLLNAGKKGEKGFERKTFTDLGRLFSRR